jgi:LuxR family quorum-sensing transcriptional regulator LasR
MAQSPKQRAPGRKDIIAKALEFAEQAAQMESLEELSAALLAIVEPLGITAIASGRLGHVGPPEAFHFAKWNPEWLKFYLQNDFMRVDPVPQWALTSGAPISSGDLLRALSKNHPGRRVIEAGRSFGYAGGYIVPQRAGDNALGVVAFVGTRDPAGLKEQFGLRLLASVAFERAEALCGRPLPLLLPLPPPKLTPQERHCLKHLVAGRSVVEIGRLMNLSAATVRFHTTNLRGKTGASNLAELAALAVAVGLVPDRPGLPKRRV